MRRFVPKNRHSFALVENVQPKSDQSKYWVVFKERSRSSCEPSQSAYFRLSPLLFSLNKGRVWTLCPTAAVFTIVVSFESSRSPKSTVTKIYLVQSDFEY